MPIVIPQKLPAHNILTEENIFVMDTKRAFSQDIRPIKIAIVNLMPTKIQTETQILRLIGNSPLQVNVTLIRTASYESKNIAKEHLNNFYKTFDDVKDEKFDGMIITGAPVENLKFEEVDYWEELTRIMEYTKNNVTSTFHICWGAQAGLYYHYGIEKYKLSKKIFGVFKHDTNMKKVKILRGFDDVFYAPHSRHTEIKTQDIMKCEELEILAHSDEAGANIISSNDGKYIFVTGHSEYDRDTLKDEYIRDVQKGLNIDIPKNYFPDDDPSKTPKVTWRSHANLLFSNWLNYYVYQVTPYDITKK